MNKLAPCIAEAIGTFALIFIGIGAINANPGLLGVALAHGLTIAVMVSATGHISGGHLNPAVTLPTFMDCMRKINVETVAGLETNICANASS